MFQKLKNKLYIWKLNNRNKKRDKLLRCLKSPKCSINDKYIQFILNKDCLSVSDQIKWKIIFDKMR